MKDEVQCGSCGLPAEYLVDDGICLECFNKRKEEDE